MDRSEPLIVELEAQGVAAGVVIASGCRVEESQDPLREEVNAAIGEAVRQKDSPSTAERKAAARAMLRCGTYRPTGRGKPASEYLLNSAAENAFPFINNLVDVNNLVSLEFLLPISMIDLHRAGSRRFTIRRGREGEEYVFNPSGQVLSLRDLLLLARMPGDEPCGTPVKDCQATKTDGATTDALAVIYAPLELRDAALAAAERMAQLLERHCGATRSIILLP